MHLVIVKFKAGKPFASICILPCMMSLFLHRLTHVMVSTAMLSLLTNHTNLPYGLRLGVAGKPTVCQLTNIKLLNLCGTDS